MYRHGIRVLLTVICLVMLASVAFAAGDINNPRGLRLNTPLQLDIPLKGSVWLSYTPWKSAIYHFVSNMNGDPDCTLYEEDTDPDSEIDSANDIDSDEDNYNFHLTSFLTEVVTYYF